MASVPDFSQSAQAPRSYARSGELFAEATNWVVGGVKRMNMLDAPDHFPLFFTRASGPFAWDADGNRYIDLIGGKGSTLFGYADPEIDDAVIQAIRAGGMLPLTPEAYHAAARLLCGLVASVERAKFFRTGSCAVSAAVRVARVFSGRRRILSCGYHGWHDWFMERSRYPDEGGAADDFFYDLGALRGLLANGKSDVAAVVVTAEPSFFPATYLAAVADICRQSDVLFVLDEVKTAFRFGPGGYQAVAHVSPDLSTFGKSIGNGYAVAALGGRADVMAAERDTHISGTYETEMVGLAAALSSMNKIRTLDYGILAGLYARFAGTLNELFRKRRVVAHVFHSVGNAHLVFADEAVARQFYRDAARSGISFYVNDDINLSFQHAEVFDRLIDILKEVIARLPSDGTGNLTESAIASYLVGHKILNAKLLDRPDTAALLSSLARQTRQS
jgi:glutamate-1-semialdehyde 2,1-aminomutase